MTHRDHKRGTIDCRSMSSNEIKFTVPIQINIHQTIMTTAFNTFMEETQPLRLLLVMDLRKM